MKICVQNLLIALVMLAWIHQVSAQNWSFLLSSSMSVDREPISVTATDVNGDGKPDLISASYLNSTLTVLTNGGNGVFGSNATYVLDPDYDSGAYSIVATDVNGDGKPDVIVVKEYDYTLEVLTNNGSGVLYSNATYDVGAGPECVIAADINDDGKPDLISANNWDNTLTALTNNGSGIFGFNATYAVGPRPISVAAADVNGDGKLDLISANYGNFPSDGNTLTVLTNNGNGIFGYNATPNIGRQPYWVAAADVNGDGWPDLISANSFDSTLTVLTNNGSGVFGSNATLNTSGDGPLFVLPVDINGDGKVDLISASGTFNHPGDLMIFTNDGNGIFDFAITLKVGLVPDCIAAPDVNGDGRPDLVCANYNDPATLSVLLNLPLPTISLTSTNTVAVTWPSLSTGWTLQQNADLETTNWLDSNFTVSDDGTNKNIIIPSPSGSLFFRLGHP